MNEYCVYKHTAPNGKVYIGLTAQRVEASQEYTRTSIKDCLRGKYKQHRGYQWRYADE